MFHNYKATDHLENTKQVDLEEQLKEHRRELENKNEVIRILTRLRGADDLPAGVISNLRLPEVTLDSPLKGASFSQDLLRSKPVDMTHLDYMRQNEGSEAEARKLRDRLKANEAAMWKLRDELERYKENDAQQTALLQSLRDHMRRTQGSSESVASSKAQVNSSIRSLQGENQELRDRVSELEERLRLHLREREQSEQRAVSAERRLAGCIEKLAQGLNEDTNRQRDPLDYLTNRACEMFQERLLWETKIATLEEALATREMEFKASQQTLMKLASEAGKAQDVAASFNQDMKAVRKERDEALLLKAAAEQESELLRERLADSQFALGTACQAQARHERWATDLDDELRASAQQSKATRALHQGLLEQLAVLLSNGLGTVPATEEAVKGKVRELSGRDRTWTAKVTSLEEEVTKLNKQVVSQSKLYHEAMRRARRAEEQLSDRDEVLSHLEGQLASKNLLKDGHQFERQRHTRFLRGLAQAMNMEQDVQIDDLEDQAEKLLARARVLAEIERERTDDSNEFLQNLQQKVTSQRERLASSKRHIQLLTDRLSQLEPREGQGGGLAELRKDVERLQGQLDVAKRKNRSLREKNEEITALKAKSREQDRTNQRLRESLEKLESVKDKAARKVVTLTSELDQVEQGALERNSQAQSLTQALSNELHSARKALEVVARRERQLVDFRESVARALGFDTNTMAIPDDKIYLQLKSLTQPHSRERRVVSHQRGPTDGLGGRLALGPSHSPPPSWGQNTIPSGSPHRGHVWGSPALPLHQAP
ncbi:coiled-coil domain-containing protein 170-like [Hemitrygon akajei]|uniref:coiled-coil domain-containing protein 170-like n=1 Tax=Hemitrygon akajei TaxID=2704970 RepID=UPI003BF9808D